MTEKNYYKKDYSSGELVHNLVMEKIIGRKLKRHEVVHHIDLIKSNDSEENLFLCKTRGIHQIIHKQFRSLGRKIAIEFLRLGIIFFDVNEEIYKINKKAFKQYFNMNEKDYPKIFKKLGLSPKELEDIKQRRYNSFRAIIKRKKEIIDRSDYNQIRKAISY